MKTPSSFSIDEAIQVGWAKMKKHFWFFVALLIVMGIISVVGDPPMEFASVNWATGEGFDWGVFKSPDRPFLYDILSTIFGFAISLVWLRILLLVHDDEKVTAASVVEGFRQFVWYALTELLYGIILIVGLLLLVVPGIIWGIRLQFAPYLALDKKMRPIAALQKSWDITEGKTLKLFYFAGANLITNIAGFLALLIGLFYTVPATRLAQTNVYRQLMDHKAPEA